MADREAKAPREIFMCVVGQMILPAKKNHLMAQKRGLYGLDDAPGKIRGEDNAADFRPDAPRDKPQIKPVCRRGRLLDTHCFFLDRIYGR
jgi:hypothetical protein